MTKKTPPRRFLCPTDATENHSCTHFIYYINVPFLLFFCEAGIVLIAVAAKKKLTTPHSTAQKAKTCYIIYYEKGENKHNRHGVVFLVFI